MSIRTPMRDSSNATALILATGFAIAIISLTVVHKLTEFKIAEAREHWLLENISAVLPEGPFDRSPVSSKKSYTLDAASTISVYTAHVNNRPTAAALELTAPQGYNGAIKLIIGLKTNGDVIGVRILDHQETPGLGDKIEYRKSSWITQFDQQSVESIPIEYWKLSRNGGYFDGLTGATVTSIAVIRTVQRALNWFEENKQQIFLQSKRL